VCVYIYIYIYSQGRFTELLYPPPPHTRAHSLASSSHGHQDDRLAPSCLPSYPLLLLLPSHSTSALACLLAMPCSGLISSPLLAPKGQLMKKHSTAVLPVLLLSIVVLLASSCEARGLPVHGKARSSSKSHRLPGKVGIIAEDYARLVSSSHSIVDS
jgi:hypothetical protein